MTPDPHTITINGITIEVIRKPIKNLHLGVYPPLGRVRVAAPLALSDDAIRLAVIRKIGWIQRQQAKFAAQPRQSQREMVGGESHYYLGQRYRLQVIAGPNQVILRNRTTLELHARPGATPEQREQILQRWYRAQLKALIPPLLEKWQPILGLEAADWRIKKMKTRWGTCNSAARRIWLNLELIKTPPECIEYVLVHELLHLRERRHNDAFRALLDAYLPGWVQERDRLNASMLGHEEWGC